MNKKELLASVLDKSGAGSVIRRAFSWDGLLVLNYHRVGNWSSTVWDQDLFSATQQVFHDQLTFLKRTCDVVGFDEIGGVANKRGRHVQITFDDGYIDNHDLAFPVLADLGLSATFFVCTGFIDQGGVPWWDELAWIVNHAKRTTSVRFRGEDLCVTRPGNNLGLVRQLNALYDQSTEVARHGFLDELAQALDSVRCTQADSSTLWMNWDMIRAMHQGGMTIGGHTLNHVELSRYGETDQLNEIKGSCERIQSEIGAPVRTFSYPYGTPHSFNDETRQALANAGIEYAYSYSGGYQNPVNWDRYDLKRTPVEAHHSAAFFRATVSLPSLFA